MSVGNFWDPTYLGKNNTEHVVQDGLASVWMYLDLGATFHVVRASTVVYIIYLNAVGRAGDPRAH